MDFRLLLVGFRLLASALASIQSSDYRKRKGDHAKHIFHFKQERDKALTISCVSLYLTTLALCCTLYASRHLFVNFGILN